MTVTFRGFPACECLAEWLPAYEAELQRRGALEGPLRIYQLIGGAKASAGTHSTGGAFDITDLIGEEDVWVARQMGADATWARTAAQGFTPHLHGVLRGCPDNAPARYQITAVEDGYNGLGLGGRGGPDDGPRPLSGRTWREGIEWARQQAQAAHEAEKDRKRARIDGHLGDAIGDVQDSLDAASRARRQTGKPRRPLVRSTIKKAKAAGAKYRRLLRKARQINRG